MKKTRKKILFKVNNKIVLEENSDLFLNQIDEFKWIIAEEMECTYDDIEIETIELDDETSEIDITVLGMMNWKDTQGTILNGVKCMLPLGSDEYFDAFANGTLEN